MMRFRNEELAGPPETTGLHRRSAPLISGRRARTRRLARTFPDTGDRVLLIRQIKQRAKAPGFLHRMDIFFLTVLDTLNFECLRIAYLPNSSRNRFEFSDARLAAPARSGQDFKGLWYDGPHEQRFDPVSESFEQALPGSLAGSVCVDSLAIQLAARPVTRDTPATE